MFTKLTKKMIIFSVGVISFQNAISVRNRPHDQRINQQDQDFNQDNLNHEQREVFRNEPPVIQQNRAEDNQNNLNVDNLTDEQRAARGLFHNEPPVIQQNRAEENQNNLNDDNLNDEQRAQRGLFHNAPPLVEPLQVNEPEQRAHVNHDAPAMLVSEALQIQFAMPDYRYPKLKDLMQNPAFGEAINQLEWQGELRQRDWAIIVDIRDERNIQIIPSDTLKRFVKKFKASNPVSLKKESYLKIEEQQSNLWLAEIDSGFLRFNYFIDRLLLAQEKATNICIKTLNYVAEALE